MENRYKRKQETVKCSCCGKDFNKDSSEIRRNEKIGRKNFCSLSCVSKFNNEHNIKNRSAQHLKYINRTDEYSIFRTHFRRIQRRTKNLDLTLQDMLEVWNTQNGICIYSGVQLQECKNVGYNNPIYCMSVDRIDSTVGYTKDNIQFISIAMNHLKNSMTHEQMLEVLTILKNM